MINQYIRKICVQHKTPIVFLPRVIQDQDIKVGDYMLIKIDKDEKKLTLTKIEDIK